ncbi:MAG: histidinol dehydrogenase [Clostridiales bacterium]|nr:histidinol dehydrogenase [Clostridiales bacterium]
MRIIQSNNSGFAEFLSQLTKRGSIEDSDQLDIVKDIIKDVKEKNDEAMFYYTEKFDGAKINKSNIEVTQIEIDDALKSLDDNMLRVLKKAAKNIRDYHVLQLEEEKSLKTDLGTVSMRYVPIDRAGVYVPGGRAAYPSSVLMNVIPAKVAGVDDVIMCTPPDEDGNVYNMTLAAASIAGAKRIFKVGGAQAIAAMAYGTETIPKVSKIVGPGNIYVALAKKEVYGQVGIDMIAGPSEVCIIADKTANPRYLASDLLSQAEHDSMAASILLCNYNNIAKEVSIEIERILEELPTKEVARTSIDDMGAIIIVKDMDEAVILANQIAPEHLEISTENPEELLPKIRNAGSIFLGEYSPEPLGDYFAGANHVLPTSGNAKFASPLGVYDFIKRQSVINYTKDGLKKVADDIITFAEGEGLYAHANSISVRYESEE